MLIIFKLIFACLKNIFGGENMKVWVSTDGYRLPLMVEAKILVGSVKAILDPGASKLAEP